jgi:hypothetical protein
MQTLGKKTANVSELMEVFIDVYWSGQNDVEKTLKDKGSHGVFS